MIGPNSLTITSGRRRGEPGLVDLVIRDGSITDIVPSGEAPPDTIDVDAAGNLVTESFVNTHLHSTRCSPCTGSTTLL